jgi:hypothetical protein
MPASINQHWYSANNSRAYPLDDAATAIDNSGDYLPSDILADAAIRFPTTYGQRASISSVTVTSKVVSVTLVAGTDNDFAPLAILTLPQPVVPGKAYTIQAQVPGVGGWLVFGGGVKDKDYRGRFLSASQAMLCAKAARAYRPFPIPSVRSIQHQQPLSGLVSLRASEPMEIVAETREIENQLRQAIVFRLVDVSGASGSNTSGTAKQESVFSKFAGPCGGRPESYTCPDPAPVEFINSIYPDCFGQITLDFRGCARLTPLEDMHGAIIECQASLADVCPEPFLPDSDGFLPSEYTPVNVPAITTTTTTTTPDPAESASGSDILPYCECFDGSTAADWVVKSGTFGFVIDDSPSEGDFCPPGSSISYESQNSSMSNLAIWNGPDALNIDRVTTADLKIMTGVPGSKHNAGILLNYRPHGSISGQFIWFAAVMDYDTQTVRFLRFNGSAAITILEVPVPGIVLDEWYRMTVTTTPGVGTTNIEIEIEGITTPAFSVTAGPFGVASYAPSSGKNGVFSDRSVSRWSYWCYDEVPI